MHLLTPATFGDPEVSGWEMAEVSQKSCTYRKKRMMRRGWPNRSDKGQRQSLSFFKKTRVLRDAQFIKLESKSNCLLCRKSKKRQPIKRHPQNANRKTPPAKCQPQNANRKTPTAS